jgi:hypothetical protein
LWQDDGETTTWAQQIYSSLQEQVLATDRLLLLGVVLGLVCIEEISIVDVAGKRRISE